MSVNIRPLGDRIIVEPVEQEETIAGGMLVLPETAKEKPQQGKVLAVGAGRRDDDGKRIPMDVEIGIDGAVRQVRGHRNQAQRQEAADHEGKRHPRDCRS